MDLPDKIRYLRVDILHLKKTELAKKLNVSRLTIHNWEQGISTPTPENIKVICTCCHVTPDFLMYPDVEYELNPFGLDDEGYNILQSLILYFENNNEVSE